MDGTAGSTYKFEGAIQEELERMEKEDGDGCGRGCSCAYPRAAAAVRKRLLDAVKQKKD